MCVCVVCVCVCVLVERLCVCECVFVERCLQAVACFYYGVAIDIVVSETDSAHNNHIINCLECVDVCVSTLFLLLFVPFGDLQSVSNDP